MFDQVAHPYSQPCPDCSAKKGEPCVLPTTPALSPTMVHVRRWFTPESNAQLERYYREQKERADISRREEWESLGHVGVDSGRLWIGDPMMLKLGALIAGCSFPAGLGDGVYNVEARYIDVKGYGRRIAEIRIVLISDEKKAKAEAAIENDKRLGCRESKLYDFGRSLQPFAGHSMADRIFTRDKTQTRLIVNDVEMGPGDCPSFSGGPHHGNIVKPKYCPYQPGDILHGIASTPVDFRIHLEVTNVRVERVQSTTYEDIHAEGGVITRRRQRFLSLYDYNVYAHLRALWAAGWDLAYGRPGAMWEDNPWVWVIEFRRA